MKASNKMAAKQVLFTGSIIAGALLGTGIPKTVNADNLFNYRSLGSGAELRTVLLELPSSRSSLELKCGSKNENKSDAKPKTTDSKAKDAKCGEGKCGDKKSESKAKDQKCGESKAADKKMESKAKDGKCGEGKCGESKSDSTKSMKKDMKDMKESKKMEKK